MKPRIVYLHRASNQKKVTNHTYGYPSSNIMVTVMHGAVWISILNSLKKDMIGP